MGAKISNDAMIQIMLALPDDLKGECVRPLLAVTEDPVLLEIPREDGEGEYEAWMIDGDQLDAIAVAIPAEAAPEIKDLSSFDWPDEFREKLITARETHYDAGRDPARD